MSRPDRPSTASPISTSRTFGVACADARRRLAASSASSSSGLTVSAAISDAQAVTAELKARRALIADAQKSLQSIDKAATEIAELSKSSRELVDGDGKRTLANLAEASEEAQGAAKDIRGMLARLDGPTNEFASSGLPQLTSAIQSLQQTAESLDRLIRDLESNPRGLVGKAPAQEMRVKP